MCRDGVRSVTEQEECLANRASAFGSLPCLCGRSFRRKGDRTRNSHFCSTVLTESPSHLVHGNLKFP